MIKIYSTQNCPYCVALKEFLTEHQFKFEDIDVAKDEKALGEMVEKTGQFGVPVVNINGQVIIGFDKEKISKLLKIKG
jgi:glutaredoxin-like YruB-family protein